MDTENKFKAKTFWTSLVYELLADWWEGHKFPVLPLNALPKKCIIIQNQNEISTHAIFPYTTDSDICWIAYPVSNPHIDKKEKEGGLESLIKFASEYAKENKFTYAFTTSPLQKVQEALLLDGYQIGDTNVNHYLKIL